MCRWQLLHDYFGEEMQDERCGNCDNCVHPLGEQIAMPDRGLAQAPAIRCGPWRSSNRTNVSDLRPSRIDILYENVYLPSTECL